MKKHAVALVLMIGLLMAGGLAGAELKEDLEAAVADATLLPTVHERQPFTPAECTPDALAQTLGKRPDQQAAYAYLQGLGLEMENEAYNFEAPLETERTVFEAVHIGDTAYTVEVVSMGLGGGSYSFVFLQDAQGIWRLIDCLMGTWALEIVQAEGAAWLVYEANGVVYNEDYTEEYSRGACACWYNLQTRRIDLRYLAEGTMIGSDGTLVSVTSAREVLVNDSNAYICVLQQAMEPAQAQLTLYDGSDGLRLVDTETRQGILPGEALSALAQDLMVQ